MASVFRWFDSWSLGGRPVGPTGYAEALQAGWVPPPPEVRSLPEPAKQVTGGGPDVPTFLARVYLNQRC